MKNIKSAAEGTEQVDEFMAKLKHPLKPEVQAIRETITDVNQEITEQIKWNAPSFSYKGENFFVLSSYLILNRR